MILHLTFLGGWQLYAFIKYARPEYASSAVKYENNQLFEGSFIHVEYVKNLQDGYHTFTHRIPPTGILTFYCCDGRTNHSPKCVWSKNSAANKGRYPLSMNDLWLMSYHKYHRFHKYRR
ncbi:hypothetical protein GJ496_006648 [Pomphorhynchus laevis]|nr:hypothetical protein GJ496_006648 [Pomphorhynchus laevis]